MVRIALHDVCKHVEFSRAINVGLILFGESQGCTFFVRRLARDTRCTRSPDGVARIQIRSLTRQPTPRLPILDSRERRGIIQHANERCVRPSEAEFRTHCVRDGEHRALCAQAAFEFNFCREEIIQGAPALQFARKILWDRPLNWSDYRGTLVVFELSKTGLFNFKALAFS